MRAIALVVFVSCTPLKTYVLSGQFYDQDSDCLDAELVVDVIAGADPGVCETVKCVQSQETGDFYVTTSCEVPALYTDFTEATDGPCPFALAAYDRGAACAEVGGGGGS